MLNLFKPEAVVVDVDGTLTNRQGLLHLKAVKYIRKVEKIGIPVLLASGNALPIVKGLAGYIGCSGAVIAEDGGVVEYKENIILLGNREEPLKFLSELKKIVGKVDESFTNRYRHVDIAIKRTMDKKILIKVLSNFPNLKLVDSGYAYHVHDIYVDKGRALLRACEMMNVNPKKVIAIGDSELDIPMFRVAGYSVALANASIVVKNEANYTTKKGYGEGFVEFIKVLMENW